jgi:geranylgeranylglycerol-phosphate geranylgeranyltransferase
MIIALLKLMRLYYALPLAGGFIVILSYLTGGNIDHIPEKAVLAFLSLVSVISAGYILNDVCDVEIDKINCPGRMLAAGKLRRKTALIWSIAFFTLGLVFGGFCNLLFFLAIAAIAGLLFFYDIFSKRIGVFKDIIVAVLMTSLYPLALTLTEPTQTPRLNVLFIHPVWLFLSSLGYEMLKDIRDVKGDRKINAVGLNYCKDKRFLLIARAFVIAGSLVTLLPFFLGYCKFVYLAASIGAIILAVFSTFNKPVVALRYIYIEIFLITSGSMADLLVFGP